MCMQVAGRFAHEVLWHCRGDSCEHLVHNACGPVLPQFWQAELSFCSILCARESLGAARSSLWIPLAAADAQSSRVELPSTPVAADVAAASGTEEEKAEMRQEGAQLDEAGEGSAATPAQQDLSESETGEVKGEGASGSAPTPGASAAARRRRAGGQRQSTGSGIRRGVKTGSTRN